MARYLPSLRETGTQGLCDTASVRMPTFRHFVRRTEFMKIFTKLFTEQIRALSIERSRSGHLYRPDKDNVPTPFPL